jgi:chromosomal replication initiation ATPase DnaA
MIPKSGNRFSDKIMRKEEKSGKHNDPSQPDRALSGMAASPRQLVLALDHTESFAREDFLRGPSNAAALALIEQWPDWPDRIVALVGPEGSGKSHLASIWAEQTGARSLSARSLSHIDLPAAFATGALVVEDLEPGVDERALFHLINLAREEKAHVLITARTTPAGLDVGVRDLASRLRAIPAVTLSAPDDTLLRALMVKLGADRQLAFDEPLVSYVANRIERSFAATRAAVAQLDEEAMRQKRPVTRALAAELFRDTPI